MAALNAWDWTLDGWIIMAGILCAVAAALLGNFLVLRRMSMLGDAISHAVLPGLAAAFFLTHSQSSLPMFLGAVIVGVLTALFTEWIRGFGQVDEGASMGVVFTSLFALGLVMIVQAADRVDLDPSCVLYGAIELTPLDTVSVFGIHIPRAVLTLGIVVVINALFVVVLFKELKISSFDSALATTFGFNARLMHYLLMILVAITAVASFETVGNILVVAMFIVPPAAAYLLTDRLGWMVVLSVILATISAIFGHISAISVPSWFGFQSTTTAGMMAVIAGLILFFAATLSPRHGIVVKLVRRWLLSWKILADDVVALLYRIEEGDRMPPQGLQAIRSLLLTDTLSLKLVLIWLRLRKQVIAVGHEFRLTLEGEAAARQLVRSHRLWEQYLASHASIEPERLHDKAEQLEHFTDRSLRQQLSDATDSPELDPHGTRIPAED